MDMKGLTNQQAKGSITSGLTEIRETFGKTKNWGCGVGRAARVWSPHSRVPQTWVQAPQLHLIVM